MSDNLNQILNNIDAIDIRASLFKKGDFDFIVKHTLEDGSVVTHEKQREALKILTSNKVKKFLYGGAAGSAKSWTGCCWLLFMCVNFPKTRWFVARNELKDIVDSVLVTFNKVADEYGFSDYKYNAVKNFIQFGNGSHINFIEIKYKPSDPEFTDLGSTEYTGGWIEEGGEVNEMGATVISTRVGRHMNKKYNLKGVVFITCNPAQNWLKTTIYDKWRNKDLPQGIIYLPAFATDNPFIPEEYIENLLALRDSNKPLFERLHNGNWDYEDNPNALCDLEMLDAIFSNDHVEQGRTYLTADIARFGSDKAVILVWKGWQVVDYLTFETSKTTEIEHAITLFRRKYLIPRERCVGDADGVGGGVIDGTGIKAFNNNSRPIPEKNSDANYRNLQVQCLYKLADKINEGEIWLNCDFSSKEKKEIREDLFQIQSKNGDYRKLDCKPKSEIKVSIGRSPDYRDAIMMRVYFDLKKRKGGRFLGTIAKTT